jgi:peptidase E
MAKEPRPAPVFLIAGGRDTKAGCYSALLARIFRSSGKDRPRIAYIGAATDDDAGFIKYMRALLESGGACDWELAPLAGRKGSHAKARRVVEASDLVFVGGGDVERGMHWLVEREMIPCLAQKHAGGAPFFGVSAGAIMLCRKWVRWKDPDDDSTVEPFDCLGLADTLCDTHCEDDGWEELKALLALEDERAVGWGIRCGAALAVGPGGTVEVVAGTADELSLHGEKARPVRAAPS